MANEEQRKYWDKYWYDNKNKKTIFNSLVAATRKYYFARAFAKFIAKHYEVTGKSVCEIGVGSSLTLGHLKRLGAGRCVGVDYSAEALNFSRSFNNDCEFFLGDAFDLTAIVDKQFDLVYSLGFLEHYSKDEQRRLIAEQKRIAKECVFIEVPYDIFYFRWLFALNRKLGRTTTFSDEELFTKKTFKQLGLSGKSYLMPTAFFLTVGHFEYLTYEYVIK